MNKILFLISLLGSIATSSGAAGAHGGSSTEKSGSQGELQSGSVPVRYDGEHFISEGSPFHITCTLTFFQGQLKWTVNGKPVNFHQTGGSLDVAEGLACAKKPVGCAVGDFGPWQGHPRQRGHAEGTETTKLLRLTKPMTIQCQITMEQKPVAQMTLKWFKDDKELQESDKYKVFQENSTLIISATTVEDVGVYRCETVDFDPAQSYEMNIIYLKVKSLPKSITVLEGGKLTIPCEVEGTPMPNVAWYKGNMSVDDAVNSTRFDLGDNNMTYEVEKAVYDDRDNYTCAISSGDIHFNTTTFVRVKDMYAALWPFLGICTEVFILCLIIFVYEKRRAKNDYEESDTDQPPEQKNTSDLNKDNVRQRK